MLIYDVNKLINDFPDSYEFLEVPNVVEVEHEIVGTTRWDTLYRVVFKRDSEYVAIEYGQGSTEYQDSEPEAFAYEVTPYEVMVTKYKKTNGPD